MAAGEGLDRVLCWISPSTMSAAHVLGPVYTSLVQYVERTGWTLFCCSLGGLCIVVELGSAVLWKR
jgi:hypothetical protein